MDNGFIFKKINENLNIKERKRSWDLFRIYQFHSNRAGLAVLISW